MSNLADQGAMFPDEQKNEVADREPYRRLIDLQKQMIELVQQHERTKRECSALREQLLEEMARPKRWSWSLRLETRWLKGLRDLGSSGWWWARNRTVPMLVPAKQQSAAKFTRPHSGNL